MTLINDTIIIVAFIVVAILFLGAIYTVLELGKTEQGALNKTKK
jgi:hypothetical protein|tara:strand:- start:5707 stop:5838 length:132 start_codon:yes stop_codon:yes gene_type:complete